MRTNFENFVITSYYTGKVECPRIPGNFNHHIIMVENIEIHESFKYSFWGSEINPKIRDKWELLKVFRILVHDATAGLMAFHRFCDEFGYDEGSWNSVVIWHTYRTSAMRLRRAYPFNSINALYKRVDAYINEYDFESNK